jgi:hypothetical protein
MGDEFLDCIQPEEGWLRGWAIISGCIVSVGSTDSNCLAPVGTVREQEIDRMDSGTSAEARKGARGADAGREVDLFPRSRMMTTVGRCKI